VLATLTTNTDPVIMVLLAGGVWSTTVPGAAVVESTGSSTSVQPLVWASVRALAAAVQHAPQLIPGVVLETDKSIAMKYPIPWEARGHFVVVPKRDIRDLGTLAKGDEPYLIDAFAVQSALPARELNGPRSTQ
jgi:hypothetical protein